MPPSREKQPTRARGRPRGTTKHKSFEDLELFLLGSSMDNSIDTKRSRLFQLIKLFNYYVKESENRILALRERVVVENGHIPHGFIKITDPKLLPYLVDPNLLDALGPPQESTR